MTSDTVGGVWTYSLVLTRALAARGVSVVLATMGRLPDGEQRAAAAGAGAVALHASGHRLEWEDDPWDDVDRAGAWLLELEAQVRPDVVHLNGYAHGSLPWRAPVVVAAHSDVVTWWWAVHGGPPPGRYERYRAAVEAGLRAADRVVAPTAAVLRDLERHYRFRTSRSVVPNATGARFEAVPKESFVAGLGRFWDEAKNVAALEAVAPALDWPLVLAGPGTGRGRLSTSEVHALLARASVFASAARYEPFGLSILEAARAGCALVLGDIPSLREVWGDAAVYAAPDDAHALLVALRLVTGDRALRDRLGRAAQRRSLAYTPGRAAAAYHALYRGCTELVAA